jgi:hypothetical protein
MPKFKPPCSSLDANRTMMLNRRSNAIIVPLNYSLSVQMALAELISSLTQDPSYTYHNSPYYTHFPSKVGN